MEIPHPPSLSTEQGDAEWPWWTSLTIGYYETGSCSAHPRIIYEGERRVSGG